MFNKLDHAKIEPFLDLYLFISKRIGKGICIFFTVVVENIQYKFDHRYSDDRCILSKNYTIVSIKITLSLQENSTCRFLSGFSIIPYLFSALSDHSSIR